MNLHLSRHCCSDTFKSLLKRQTETKFEVWCVHWIESDTPCCMPYKNIYQLKSHPCQVLSAYCQYVSQNSFHHRIRGYIDFMNSGSNMLLGKILGSAFLPIVNRDLQHEKHRRFTLSLSTKWLNSSCCLRTVRSAVASIPIRKVLSHPHQFLSHRNLDRVGLAVSFSNFMICMNYAFPWNSDR